MHHPKHVASQAANRVAFPWMIDDSISTSLRF
jgi:hypothetical protein